MWKSGFLFILLVASDGCIDRINIEDSNSKGGILVVEGVITDQPGPYSVRLFRSSKNNDLLNIAPPVLASQVTIIDDLGVSEILSTRGDGVYFTNVDGIQGEIGRKYKLRIELRDGTIFESEEDEMNPVESIDSLYYVWESYLPQNGPTEYGFRVYMDSKGDPRIKNHIRWKFTGTYLFRTIPEYHYTTGPCGSPPPDPLPCSGFAWNGTILMRFDDCTCCFCWVSDFEDKPHLSNNSILTNGTFKKIEMGYVPFDQFRFLYNKYMIKVEQMSLSNAAYQFWKIIEDQKDGSSSLFNPSFGKIKTNIFSVNSKQEAQGIFYASAIRKKVAFITGTDAQVKIPQLEVPIEQSCMFFDACDKALFHASRTPPPEWK